MTVAPLPAAAAALPVALLAAWLITPLAIRAAWRLGMIDHPEERRIHTRSTALLGGAAIFVAALLGWLAVLAGQRAVPETETVLLIAGAVVALGLGLWDDRFGMRPSIKLAGQAAAAALILATGAWPDSGLPPALAATLALVALIALMNAVNFLDNMNGMVPGLAAIALLGFAWGSLARGAPGLAAAQLALAGACIGVLRYNFPEARIFLGDAGSLFLGYSLGASAVLALRAAPIGWGSAGPLLALAYPAFDMIFVVVTRLRDGRKVYLGGRDHTNHRLASVLQCQKRTVTILWVVGAALSASGFVVQQLNHPLPTLLLSGLWTILLLSAGLRLSAVPINSPAPARQSA